MNLMRLYRFEFVDKGTTFLAEPSIPETVSFIEDSTTPRICVCPHIMGCIQALELPESVVSFNKEWKSSNLYLYQALIDLDRCRSEGIIQPTINQVPDVWKTGEIWILKPTVFNKVGEFTLSKQFDLPNCAYSRYQVVPNIEDAMVIDRVVGPVIYGDLEEGFSFIGFNDLKVKEAREYAKEHPLF